MTLGRLKVWKCFFSYTFLYAMLSIHSSNCLDWLCALLENKKPMVMNKLEICCLILGRQACWQTYLCPWPLMWCIESNSQLLVSTYFLQTRAWKRWELETLSHDYEFSNGMLSYLKGQAPCLCYSLNFSSSSPNIILEYQGLYAQLDIILCIDPSRFRLTHETSFVRSHTSFWTRIPFFFYVVRIISLN